ncbi:MAG: response regulator transcription factor [Chloroflexi bacterium]|nr:response regulator transcription factor [Chloroflexota bacterium]
MTVTGRTILVVDDEPDILELVSRRLELAGYRVLCANSGSAALRLFYQQQPDLAIVDIDMPKMNGLDVCRRIREVSEIPVIFLTAYGAEEDRVKGLEAGADDYIVKPFGKNELAARVGAALRRASLPPGKTTQAVYSDGEIIIDHSAHTVVVRGTPISLSPLEYKLLVALVRNAGQVLSQERLLDVVWGQDALEVSPESVRLYVSYLRNKIEQDPKHPRLITTVRQFGYRYVPANAVGATA